MKHNRNMDILLLFNTIYFLTIVRYPPSPRIVSYDYTIFEPPSTVIHSVNSSIVSRSSNIHKHYSSYPASWTCTITGSGRHRAEGCGYHDTSPCAPLHLTIALDFSSSSSSSFADDDDGLRSANLLPRFVLRRKFRLIPSRYTSADEMNTWGRSFVRSLEDVL